MTTVVTGVQANCPAPLFRVVARAAVSSYRPVTRLAGQACSGFGAVSQVESVYGGLTLRVAPHQTEQVQVESVQAEQALTEQARVQLVQAGRREALLARTGGFDGNDGIFSDTDGSTDGGNGSKPMSPWGYRTSSPPG